MINLSFLEPKHAYGLLASHLFHLLSEIELGHTVPVCLIEQVMFQLNPLECNLYTD